MLGVLWQRFLWLGWIGKTVTVIAALYGFGWILGNLGLDSAARSLGSTAIYIGSFLLTALVIRGLWRWGTARHR